VSLECDIFDAEEILREADELEQNPPRGDTALDAYFAALERCPKIAPQRQVEMAEEFRQEIAACRDILDQIPGKVVPLTQVLEQVLHGERLENCFLPARQEKEKQQQPGSLDRYVFFKTLQERSALKHPRLADWGIRPNLILAWSRDFIRRYAELPPRPWISRIIPSRRRSSAELARWAQAVKQFESDTGLRINEFAHWICRLGPHAERAGSLFKALVESNLKLVIHIAKRFQNRGLALEDLIQEGNLGLMKSIERFDPERGFHLSTYAVCWIKQSVLRALVMQGHLVRFPPAAHELLRNIQKLREAAAQEGKPEPATEALAAALKTSPQNIEAALSMSRIGSLHEPTGEREENTLEQALVGDEGVTLDEGEALREAMAQLLKSLDPRERRVLRLHYGLSKGCATTIEEIAARLKLSRERVRQIEAKAIAKLRADATVQSERIRFLET
jgi:RNA polymerase sigma factor (sigma-70 family)